MRTLVYGAGPIGQWLALHMSRAGQDVTLLARGETHRQLERDGIRLTDGLTGERSVARVDLVDRLDPNDAYDLALVALSKAGRLAVSRTLARNDCIEHIVFLGNDVAGAQSDLDHLSRDRLLLGFPGAGGGWVGDDLVFLDREKPGSERGPIYLGEIDGRVRDRTRHIAALLRACGFVVNIESDIDGWLKYHFAFMAPTAGVIFQCGGEPSAVADDLDAIHRYCRACREAGNVFRAVGHRKRQPFVFNLYYWTPRWLEGPTFRRFFRSRMAEVGFGLHARVVGPELHQLAAEFTELKVRAGMETPDLDALLACVPEVSTLPEQGGGLEMTRVLVAGATGYLGGHVIRELAARGLFVRALVRSVANAERLRGVVDELIEGEVTRPETLQHVCDGIDVVFSSVGITRQRDGLTFQDVDYQGNKNLLDVAERAGVRKFIYVSVLGGPNLLHLAIAKAHEDFVEALKASDLDYAVLRPTGFFSDMAEYLKMASKGRAYVLARGRSRVNPIHGADLAKVCADAVEGTQREIDVGGPEVLTQREIAELAFRALGKPARISSVPVWIIRLVTAVAKLVNRHRGELLAFFTTAMSTDVIAPRTGYRTLDHYFRELSPPTTTGGSDERR